MERIQQLVRAYILAEAPGEEMNEVISDISSEKATLLHVVKALGEFLTSENESVRSKGVELLSSVIAQCPEDKVTGHSAHVLTVFYCDKLDDTDTVIPALKGLASLSFHPSFSSGDAVSLSKAIFQHVTMKAHVQPTRFAVFTIFDNLMSKHREALKGMGNEFIRGYVEVAEGEKDPRNLLLAFSIARVILIEFDIANHVEDLFNITFCYFPISFRPPPGDPYSITPDHLKQTLRSCLNATPRFGPLAMPLFLEKLSAGSGPTKRDTIQTIASCLPVYGASISRSYASQLWGALKLEIFQPIDPETADSAFEAIQTLIRILYPDKGSVVSMDVVPEGLGKQIVEECLEFLREPEKSKAKPAIKAMAALIRTTSFITKFTISQTVPLLVGLFRDPAEVLNRPATLTALDVILRSVTDLFMNQKGEQTTRSYETERPLDDFKDDVLAVLTVGLKSSNSILPALDGLDTVITIPNLLTDEELGFVVHSINETLAPTTASTDEVRNRALDVLSGVSHVAPKHVEQTTLPMLFTSLPDSAPPHDVLIQHAQYRRMLSNLQSLCIAPALFETLVIRLITKLDLICASATNELDQEANAAYAYFVLLTLSKVLATKIDKGHVDVPKYLDRLVPHLYELFIKTCFPSAESIPTFSVATNPRLIKIASQLVQQIIQTVPAERQQTFAKFLFAAFLEGQVGGIIDDHQERFAKIAFQPFENGVASAQKALVPLFAVPLVAFRKEIRLPVADEKVFLSNLITWILDSAETTIESIPVVHAVSSVINKHAETLVEFLSSRDGLWGKVIANPEVSLERRRTAIQTWSWITKALVLRNHEIGSTYVNMLFSLFDDESVNWDAAKAIGEIGSGGKDVLTKKNFAVLKVLSTQKFFNSVLPRIINGVESNQAEPSRQTPYLVTLASLIKSIPKSIYASHMHKLMPLLLRGLELPDLVMRADVIETLSSAAEDPASSGEGIQTAISEYASSLVTAMLKNGQMHENSRLRRVALRYLGLLPGVVRYDILHPYKTTVIRELGVCLDDPKRDVRKEAVDARTNWYNYKSS